MLKFADDTEITSLKSERLAVTVYLHFNSWSSSRAFVEKYLTGQIQHAFLPLQDKLRKQPGLENVELEFVVNVEDLFYSVKYIGSP